MADDRLRDEFAWGVMPGVVAAPSLNRLGEATDLPDEVFIPAHNGVNGEGGAIIFLCRADVGPKPKHQKSEWSALGGLADRDVKVSGMSIIHVEPLGEKFTRSPTLTHFFRVYDLS